MIQKTTEMKEGQGIDPACTDGGLFPPPQSLLVEPDPRNISAMANREIYEYILRGVREDEYRANRTKLRWSSTIPDLW